ncbi:right-handed parallel beta-helix repeat-containing protein [Haladaptatus sp. CMAA 1911]|uniref:right-handed parallel beta-helix repeat-containing protein n=1 Tax=unclassified Haladaptatus TaxID=2622732 RepID=UPI003754B464
MRGRNEVDRREYIKLLAVAAFTYPEIRSGIENRETSDIQKMTENHDYFTATGANVDWRKLFDENIDRLDTDVEIRDAESNLGSYTPKHGAKFLALNTERMFIGDGNRWRAIESSGISPSVDAVGTRSLSETVIYAAEYDSLQGAIDDVSAGQTVVIPAGTSTIQNPPIEVPEKVTIRGDRSGSTLRLPDGANTHAITIAEGSVDVTLEKFRVDANGDNQDTSLPRGNLHVIQKRSGASSVLYRDLTVTDGAKGAAIGNDGGNDIVCMNCNGYRGGKNGAPCDFIFNNLVTSLQVSGCYIENFTDTAVAQDNVQNTTVYGNIIKDCQSQAVTFVKNSSRGAIVNNRVVNSGNPSVDGAIVVNPYETDKQPTEVVVANNTVSDCPSNGIFVDASRVGTIGNVVTGNDGVGIFYRGGTYGGIVGNIVMDSGTTESPAPGIRLGSAGSRHSIHNVVGMNVTQNAGSAQSFGIEIDSPSVNNNSFVGNSASRHTRGAWNVPGRENIRVGNNPPMPLASGSVSLDAGGSQVVWSSSHTVFHPIISLMALGGMGQANSFVTTDGTNTQISVREIGGENPVEVRWAVWP